MTHTTFNLFVFGAAPYLLGSIPFGFLIGRMRGVDIRTAGSGNIGATNVFRTIGKGWGILTLVLDAAKGVAAVLLLPSLAPESVTDQSAWVLLSGLAVISGHNWTIFLRFRGGKGVATSVGVLFALAPIAALAGLAVWCAVLLISRYVSLASICAAAVLAVLVWPLYVRDGLLLPLALTFMALLSVWRHRSNIRRLIDGTENRFGHGKSDSDKACQT